MNIHPLTLLDAKHIDRLVAKYAALPVSKDSVELFRAQLTAINAWFVEVDDIGLIYLVDIIPTFLANFRFVFWDGKLSADRRDVMKGAIVRAFEEFELTRIQAFTMQENTPVLVTLKKVGFVEEAVLQNAWREGNQDYNLVIHRMLRSEMPEWQPLQLTTSLEAVT